MTIYLSGSFQSSWTLIDFYWKRDYYTQNYCVNLDAEITQCRASCYLEKKLTSENEDSSNPEIALVKNSKFVELPVQELLDQSIIKMDTSDLLNYHLDNYKFEFSYKIFHPPKS